MSARTLEPLVHAQRAGRVLVVTMARTPVNARDDALVDQLEAALDVACGDESLSVLHLRSGLEVFSAGADLALIWQSIATAQGHETMLALVRRMQALYQKLEGAPLITLAELRGAALGGGFELALGYDLRIAALEARVGLPSLCALADQVVIARHDLLLHERLALPMGFGRAMIKTMLWQAWSAGLGKCIEAEAQAICMQTNDFECAYHAFAEKRKPVLEGN